MENGKVGQKGGEVIYMSPTTRELARDATVGMTDREVVRATGLSFATWRKLKDGLGVPSEKTILQLSAGLGISADPFLKARAEELGREPNPDAVFLTAVEVSPLTQERKRRLVECYRVLVGEQYQANHVAA